MNRFTMSATNRSSLFEALSNLDPTRLYDVEWRERKSKRTIDQNSRLWGVLYKQLGDHIGLDNDEVHQMCGYKFLRYQKEVNGKTQEFIKSTTKLNTAEMADYQDAISRWASELGVWIE
jgi:hypothetical protein